MGNSYANNALSVANLNFNDIKTNLKNFLRGKQEFLDYDFENSTMSILLDVLAYATYQQAFYLNMVANESFLDTAVLRENVVSRAKELNYVPSSARSSEATIQVNILPDDSPNEIVIPAYTQFTSVLDNVTYTFVTDQDYTVTDSGGGVFTQNLTIFEGNVLTYTFTVGSTSPKFEIPNPNLDTTGLVVYTLQNTLDTNKVIYTPYSNLDVITANTNVYYLEENGSGNYDLYFGDNVLGHTPEMARLVKAVCRFTNGSVADGIQTFTPVSYVAYNKDNSTKKYQAASTSTVLPSSGGQDREDIEHIRFLAPKFYGMQNRLVTEQDYKAYILSKWSDLSAISVWGGEKNDPPYYGKVLISVKPRNGFSISLPRKQEIVDDLSKRCILAIDPVIADPSFTFINLGFRVTYDATGTTLTQSQIYNKISSAIASYEDVNLGIFMKGFRMSDLVATLNSVDPSILNVDPTMKVEQRIDPILNDSITYRLKFNTQAYHPYDGYLGCITSTGFTISGDAQTHFIDDDGFGTLRLYVLSDSKKIYTDNNVGTINYVTGELILGSIIITSSLDATGEIRILMQPLNTMYVPQLNEILLLSYPTITMYDQSTKQITLIQTTNVNGNSGSPIKSSRIFLPVPNPNLI